MLTYCQRQCKPVQPSWRGIWQYLTKLHMHLPSDPAIPVGIYPEETPQNTYTQGYLLQHHL